VMAIEGHCVAYKMSSTYLQIENKQIEIITKQKNNTASKHNERSNQRGRE